MSIQSQIESDIAKIEPGRIFGYQALPIYQTSPDSTVRAMSRLVKTGQIRRFSKGNFYRTTQGLLGEVPPSDREKINAFLFSGDKRTGYVTGPSLYNRLGLTTQIPKIITIATENSRQKKDLGNIAVKLVPAKAPITEKNTGYLELLDAFSDIKNIPDNRPSETLKLLSYKLEHLATDSLKKLARLALLYYPPATKALLGLTMETMGYDSGQPLLKSLNPTTRYKIGLDGQWLLAKGWNIE